MEEELPVILLSGMAADERLFAPQMAALPNVRVAAWIPPLPCESLRSYAARLAQIVDPGSPCIVGGASFGGMVALEMAPLLQARACLLIGSVRSSDELPLRWRVLRPLALLGPGALRLAAGCMLRLVERWLAPRTRRRLRKLVRSEAAFVRWAMCAAVCWRPSPAVRRVTVFQIHGEEDDTLPSAGTRPDWIVPAGRHALPLTNAVAVTDFIRRSRERLSSLSVQR